MQKKTVYRSIVAVVTIAVAAAHLLLSSQAGAQAQASGEPPVYPPLTAHNPEVGVVLEMREAYSVLEFGWFDAQRQRRVPVRLYLPNVASAVVPVPLIAFSHGIGGSRAGYSHLGRYWASNGFASLHVQHLGSDRAIWTGGAFGPLSILVNLQDAAQDTNAIHRARDISFALTQALGAAELAGKLDAGKIIAAGHSYGANTTMLLAGAEVERDGQRIRLRDPRVKAALIISAPPFYGDSDLAKIVQPISVPTLHVTGTKDEIAVPGYRSGAQDRVRVFEAMQSVKELVLFEGATHSIFTDRIDRSGLDLNARVKAATREVSVRFFADVLEANGETAQLKRVTAWLGDNSGIVAKKPVQSASSAVPPQ